MENQVKFLTVKDVIKQLSELDPELLDSEVCFSEPNGEELLVIGIQNITVLKSENEEGETATVVSIAGSLEAEDECDCEACQEERASKSLEEDKFTDMHNTIMLQQLYLDCLKEAGIKHWEGFKYFTQIFKDKLIAEGYDPSNFAI